MARFDYLNDKPKNKPKWYDQPKPKVVPKKQEQIWDEPGAGPAFWQTNNTEPEFGYVPTGPTKPVPWQNQYPAWMKPPVNKPSAPWVNPLPEQHNRPAYFNNRSTPADFYRWVDSFEQPEKAIEVIEKDYQQYEKTLNEQLDFIGSGPPNPVDQLMDKDTPWWERLGAASQQALMNYGQGANWVDNKAMIEDYQRKFMNTYIPEDERLYAQPGTLYGNRFIAQRAAQNYAYPPDNTNKFLTDYQGMDQARDKVGKLNQLDYALTQASPFFQPITDEFGNVLAPAPLTPKEYAEGVEDGKIYDPNMPDSLPKYGKTELVIENGQLIPYEMWYRAKTDQMGLFGGNWNLPMFSDTEGYQYNAPGMNFQGNQMRWLDIQNFVNLKNFENKTNKVGVKTDGTMGQPGQAMPFGFNPGIDFQIPNQIHSGTEMVEDPNLGEDLGGGGGGGGGWGDSGGYGPSYWGNPNSSGYYGNQNYGPNYWGNSGGYGSNGYGGSNSYGPNYQNNQYGLRKGQYFSQLARWVI